MSDGGNQLHLQFNAPVATGVPASPFGQTPMEVYGPGTLPAAASQPLPAQPALDPAATAARLPMPDAPVGPVEPQLEPNQILLSDGRVVEVMETAPRHDFAMQKLLTAAGFSLTGANAMGYTTAMALCAIYAIGPLDPATGRPDPQQWRPIPVPRTVAMWEERQDLIPRTSDSLLIVDLYNKVNGNGGDNFRR